MNQQERPLDYIQGLKQNWKSDLKSGSIVFLIALPLCLGIAMASGVPPASGLIAGMIGGVVLSLFSGSHLTINGPAAGLAVLVLTCVEGFRALAPVDMTPDQRDWFAYQSMLGVGVIAGLLQIGFGLLRAGVLSALIPSAVVHGMMAAIGIMIFSKQIHVAMGLKPIAHSTFELIRLIPSSIQHANPEVLVISLMGICVLLLIPKLQKWKAFQFLPAPLVAVLGGVVLGKAFDLSHEHQYQIFNSSYELGPKLLVTLPAHFSEAITFPKFDLVFSSFGLQMILTFAFVASIESLLTVVAVDKMDSHHRQSNYNRELWAQGFGNALSASLGGLPIIAEVVRSSANVGYGAKTRWSNFFHGVLLVVFATQFPSLLHQVPLASLAAILLVVGYRLASPFEFVKNYRMGKEQFLIFMTTVIGTLATDLLMGVALGILMKFLIHSWYGVPLRDLFRPFFTVKPLDEADGVRIEIKNSAVISNYLSFMKQLRSLNAKLIIVDFSDADYVDSLVVENLKNEVRIAAQNGVDLQLVGFEELIPLSPKSGASTYVRTLNE